MKLKRFAIGVILLIFFCFTVSVFTWKWFDHYTLCNFQKYIPNGAAERFVSMVIDAYETKNYEVLNKIANDEALIQLEKLQIEGKELTRIESLDSLKSTYNYRVFFQEDQYFDVYLDYEAWPQCPDSEYTDSEIQKHFFLAKVGSWHNP